MLPRAVAKAQTWLSPLSHPLQQPHACAWWWQGLEEPQRMRAFEIHEANQEANALKSPLFISSREIKPTRALGHPGAPFETGSQQRRLLLLELPQGFYLSAPSLNSSLEQGNTGQEGQPQLCPAPCHGSGCSYTHPPVPSTSPEWMVKGRAHHVLQRHQGGLWLTEPSYFQLLTCLLE